MHMCRHPYILTDVWWMFSSLLDFSYFSRNKITYYFKLNLESDTKNIFKFWKHLLRPVCATKIFNWQYEFWFVLSRTKYQNSDLYITVTRLRKKFLYTLYIKVYRGGGWGLQGESETSACAKYLHFSFYTWSSIFLLLMTIKELKQWYKSACFYDI